MTNPYWNRAELGMGPWRTWLTDHGSLTLRLRANFPDFNVLRLRQAVGRPCYDEPATLGRDSHPPVVIREVLLRSGTLPLVFAHTVIPVAGLHGPWQGLAGLGNRSLGLALFTNPLVRRFPLEFKLLDRRHPLYRAALAHLDRPVRRLWARRSHFALAGHSLMVSEVFLPSVLQP